MFSVWSSIFICSFYRLTGAPCRPQMSGDVSGERDPVTPKTTTCSENKEQHTHFYRLRLELLFFCSFLYRDCGRQGDCLHGVCRGMKVQSSHHIFCCQQNPNVLAAGRPHLLRPSSSSECFMWFKLYDVRSVYRRKAPRFFPLNPTECRSLIVLVATDGFHVLT